MNTTAFMYSLRAPRGFTLIELLVVIAIIGVLSAVVLASLNTARSRGADAAVKSNLANARAEAELYYDGNVNSYAGVCAATGANTIGDNVRAAALAAGLSTYSIDTTGTTANAVCNTSAGAWAAQSMLKSSGVYCVDSTGAAVTATTSRLSSGTDYVCSS